MNGITCMRDLPMQFKIALCVPRVGPGQHTQHALTNQPKLSLKNQGPSRNARVGLKSSWKVVVGPVHPSRLHHEACVSSLGAPRPLPPLHPVVGPKLLSERAPRSGGTITPTILTQIVLERKTSTSVRQTYKPCSLMRMQAPSDGPSMLIISSKTPAPRMRDSSIGNAGSGPPSRSIFKRRHGTRTKKSFY